MLSVLQTFSLLEGDYKVKCERLKMATHFLIFLEREREQESMGGGAAGERERES